MKIIIIAAVLICLLQFLDISSQNELIDVLRGNKYPFLVYVKMHGGVPCLGSIISGRWILTAAVCFKNYIFKIDWEGENIVELAAKTLCPGTKPKYRIKDIVIHPDYTVNLIFTPVKKGARIWGLENNIALVHLADRIPLSYKLYVGVSILSSETLTPHQTIIIPGLVKYGRNNLKSFETKTIHNDLCNKTAVVPIYDGQICTENGRWPFLFDSVGGPVLHGDKQWALVSQVHISRSKPTILTKIDPYLSWINKAIGRRS